MREGSEFKQLGPFTRLGDKYAITLNFTKGTHKLSVYNTVEQKYYLNKSAGTLTVEGDIAKLYKYDNYTDDKKMILLNLTLSVTVSILLSSLMTGI